VEQQLKISHQTTSQMISKLDADSNRRLSAINVLGTLFEKEVELNEDEEFAKQQKAMKKFAGKLKARLHRRKSSAAYKVVPEVPEGGSDDAAADQGNGRGVFTEWHRQAKDLTCIRLRNVHYEYQVPG
jgi:hypothetical protein